MRRGSVSSAQCTRHIAECDDPNPICGLYAVRKPSPQKKECPMDNQDTNTANPTYELNSTIPGYSVPLNRNDDCPRKTWLLSQHLYQLTSRTEMSTNTRRKITVLAQKLWACDAGYKTGGNRCCQSVCPRCQGIKAKSYRKQVEKIVRSRGESRFGLLTATVASDTILAGYQALQESTRKLRNRKYWQERVLGGVVQSDFKPSNDGYTVRWNVHSHAIVELWEGMTMDNFTLGMMWDPYLAKSDLVGDIDIRMINPANLQTSFMPPSYYVTKRVRGELLAMDDSRLLELIGFLPRRRIFSVFGDWRKRKKKSSRLSTARGSATKELDHVAG